MPSNKKYAGQVVMLFILIVLMFLLVILEGGVVDDQDTKYCDMVKLHKDSGNDSNIGWADYKNTYDQECQD